MTTMYRRPKFLEVLLEIRREMAHEADYDVDLFAEIARSGVRQKDDEPLPKAAENEGPANGRMDPRTSESKVRATE